MSLIPKWFIRKRGLASGLVLAGTGVGGMVLAPLIQFMIDIAGWRYAFLILSGTILGVLVPMTALFHRRSPQEVGQYPDGVPSFSSSPPSPQPAGFRNDTRSPARSEQWTLGAALCTRPFWWIAFVDFSLGFYGNMLIVHQAAHVVDAGYSPILAASLVGLVGLFRSLGAIFYGFLSDRVGREIGYTLGSSAAFVGVVFFLFVRDTSSVWMLYAFAILYGLGSGSTGPIYAATTGDLFPGNSLGRILGIMSIGYGFGGSLGAYVGGYFYDRMGSYTLPFLLVLASISAGILGIWSAAPRLRRSVHKSVKGPHLDP